MSGDEKKEERSFCELPALPLERIYQYLCVKDRRNLGLTCSHNLAIYQRLNQWMFASLCERHLLAFSDNIEHVRSLVLRLYAGSPEKFNIFLSRHAEIQRLEIESCYELGLETLLEILTLPKLRYLTFQSYGDFHRHSKILIKKNKIPDSASGSNVSSGHLEFLKLDLNVSCSEATLLYVLKLTGTQIKSLHLFSKVNDEILSYVANNYHALEALILENFEMCIQGLQEVLRNCRNLADLSIGPRWQLPWTPPELSWEDEMTILCPFFSNLHRLALTFNCHLCVRTLETVASHCTSLKTLVLWTPTTPELMVSLSKHLKGLEKMEVVFGEIFPHHIYELLLVYPLLKVFSLRRSQVTEYKGWKPDTMSSRLTKTTLAFEECYLEDAALDKLLISAPCIVQVNLAKSTISKSPSGSSLNKNNCRIVVDGVPSKQKFPAVSVRKVKSRLLNII